MAKEKCFNGLSEFYLESDGRAIHCNIGEGKATYADSIQKHDYKLMRLFRSSSSRKLRKNCKKCKIRCHQLVYFFPERDSILKISVHLVSLWFKLTIAILRKRK